MSNETTKNAWKWAKSVQKDPPCNRNLQFSTNWLVDFCISWKNPYSFLCSNFYKSNICFWFKYSIAYSAVSGKCSFYGENVREKVYLQDSINDLYMFDKITICKTNRRFFKLTTEKLKLEVLCSLCHRRCTYTKYWKASLKASASEEKLTKAPRLALNSRTRKTFFIAKS